MTGSGLAVWRGSPNHYTGRQGYGVDHITLHIMVGTLESCANWFADPASRAASHYGVGGDGTICQFVDEDDGSWADANPASDCSGVTIEHEGGMDGVPVTDAEVEASARLCADIAIRHGLGRLWHDPSGQLKGNVYLHREIPGTDHATCPDLAPNGLPVDRLIARANEIIEGEDMPSAQEIADAVVNYDLNGVKLRDRVIGMDGAANRAASNTDGIRATIDRNDGRLHRLLQSVKRLTGVADDDSQTVPDLTRTMIDSRVYRTTRMLKRWFGIGDEDMDVPEQVASPQVAALADTLAQVSAKLDAIDARLARLEDAHE